MSSYIHLRGVRIHAYHGVMPQEQSVGADFIVDLRVGCSIEHAIETDNVENTISYAELYNIVEAEMQKPSKLLEHVAGHIARAVERAFPEISSIDLTITKVNPPMGADCSGAGIELHLA